MSQLNLQSYEGLAKLVVALMLEHGRVQLIDQFGLNLLEVWPVVLQLGDQVVKIMQKPHSEILFGVHWIQHVAAILLDHLKRNV